MELAEDRVQWWALVLAVLNRCVLLSDDWYSTCNRVYCWMDGVVC